MWFYVTQLCVTVLLYIFFYFFCHCLFYYYFAIFILLLFYGLSAWNKDWLDKLQNETCSGWYQEITSKFDGNKIHAIYSARSRCWTSSQTEGMKVIHPRDYTYSLCHGVLITRVYVDARLHWSLRGTQWLSHRLSVGVWRSEWHRLVQWLCMLMAGVRQRGRQRDAWTLRSWLFMARSQLFMNATRYINIPFPPWLLNTVCGDYDGTVTDCRILKRTTTHSR